MHQAHAAITKWAIEYEKPAADAFQDNNPDAVVYNSNCNVVLHAAMAKAAMADQCEASEAAIAESQAFDPQLLASIPLPGEVEFICGGPPCQVRSSRDHLCCVACHAFACYACHAAAGATCSSGCRRKCDGVMITRCYQGLAAVHSVCCLKLQSLKNSTLGSNLRSVIVSVHSVP